MLFVDKSAQGKLVEQEELSWEERLRNEIDAAICGGPEVREEIEAIIKEAVINGLSDTERVLVAVEAVIKARVQYALTKNPFHALLAVDACAQAGLPIPRWAATCFKSCLDEASCGTGSLDQVFNWDHLIFRAVEREGDQPERILARVNGRRRQGESVDEGLFESVAQELGVSSMGQCRKLYYREKNAADDMDMVAKQLNLDFTD